MLFADCCNGFMWVTGCLWPMHLYFSHFLGTHISKEIHISLQFVRPLLQLSFMRFVHYFIHLIVKSILPIHKSTPITPGVWVLQKPLLFKEKEWDWVSFTSHMSPGGAVEQIAEWQQHMLALFSPATWHLSPARPAQLKGLFLSRPAHSIWKSRRPTNTDYSMSDH